MCSSDLSSEESKAVFPNGNEALSMTGHIPAVICCFDAADSPLAVVRKTGIYGLRVEEIGEMNEAGFLASTIDVEAKLSPVANREKNQLILKLKMVAKASIEHFA